MDYNQVLNNILLERFVMRVEFARGEDYSELMDFVHGVFSRNTPTHPRFEDFYPELFFPTDASMGRHAIVRENGRIAACIGMYKMELQAGSCRIPFGGIGQVSTGAAFQGRGFMSALLKAQLARAKEEGLALLWLGGRNDRYRRFGFEVVGLSWRYHADARSVVSLPCDAVIERMPANAQTVTPSLFAIREKTVEGVIEPLSVYHARLKRGAYELVTAVESGKTDVTAWAIVANEEGKSTRIIEWCGTESGRLAIFAKLGQARCGVAREESIASHAINEALRGASHWMTPVSTQLALIDRARLFEAYEPYCRGIDLTPYREMESQALLRTVFGPESSSFPHLPFYLPEFSHV